MSQKLEAPPQEKGKGDNDDWDVELINVETSSIFWGRVSTKASSPLVMRFTPKILHVERCLLNTQ